MSTAAESTKAFASELAELGAAPDWLAALRANAAARFGESGFPGPRDEDWKYTSAGPILRHVYRSAVAAASAGARAADATVAAAVAECGAAADSVVAVFVDGLLATEHSRGLAQDTGGAAVSGLAEQLERDPSVLEGRLGRYLDAGAHGFASLNSAFLADGAVVRVARGTAAPMSIHLVFVATGAAADDAAAEPIAAHPRNLVVLEAGASARIVEHYVGTPGVHLTNAATEIVLERDASLSHVKVQREDAEAFHVHRIQVQQGAGSRFSSHSVAIGARLSRTEIHATLAGEQAECEMSGLYVVGGSAHVDHHTTIDHAEPHTRSRELYKGILDDKSRGVFTGKVLVRRDAQQISAEQTNKSLLLADGAVAETRPQLEIYADDVKCSHGAAIGRLDEDALFYLRQRGIGEAEARSLMTYGFGNEIIESIDDEDVATTLRALVRERIERSHAARAGLGGADAGGQGR